MKKIALPNGIEVSEIALGAMNFGTSTPEDDAFRVLDHYVEIGGNFIDTSNNYAHWLGSGDESETVLGKWIKDRGCRDKIVLATKVGFDRHGEGAGLKKEQIEYWIDESLRKLNTDYVDLYYAHTDDMNTPMDETLEAFHRLVKKGKVRALGASNFDTWRFAEANMTAEIKGLTQYTVMQQNFTYLNPKWNAAPKYTFNEIANRERLRFLREKDIPLVAYSSLCKGAYDDPTRLPAAFEGGTRLEYIRNMAAEKGVCGSAMAIAWMTNLYRVEGYPRVIPLFGSSYKHFVENIKGIEIELSDEELKKMTAAE